jgi:AmmeMemoRadiSam system protein B
LALGLVALGLAALGLLALCATACQAPAPAALSTWASRGESLLPYKVRQAPEQALKSGDFPVAGICSHHLLASGHIDAWFSALAAEREVKTFIVASPAHFDESYGTVLACSADWRAAGGAMVPVDRPMLRRIAKRGVKSEREPFIGEHGVSALVPYIAKYFPRSKIIAVIYPGEPAQIGPLAKRLSAAVLPELLGSSGRNNFLLVSSDFSHHAGIAVTEKRDSVSRAFLASPNQDTWGYAGCDNRVGMRLLAALAEKTSGPYLAEGRIYWHTNGQRLFPQLVNPEDVTSYFFWFLVKAKQ